MSPRRAREGKDGGRPRNVLHSRREGSLVVGVVVAGRLVREDKVVY